MNNSTEMTNNIEQDEVEIDLLELFFYLRAKIAWLILALLIGAVSVGAFVYFMVTPTYTATSKIYMVSASSDSVLNLSDLNLGTSLSEDYVELMKLRPVFNEVIEKLELDYTYDELIEMTSISLVGNTRLLMISVTDEDPKEAREIANTLAETAVTYIPNVMETSTPNIAEYAILPEEPSAPHLKKDIALGGLIAMLLVAAIFVIQFISDDTVKSMDDVEKTFGVMPLTVIPEGDLPTISDKVEHEKEHKHRKIKRS